MSENEEFIERFLRREVDKLITGPGTFSQKAAQLSEQQRKELNHASKVALRTFESVQARRLVQARQCELLCKIGVAIQNSKAEAARELLAQYLENYTPNTAAEVTFERLAEALDSSNLEKSDELLLKVLTRELRYQP